MWSADLSSSTRGGQVCELFVIKSRRNTPSATGLKESPQPDVSLVGSVKVMSLFGKSIDVLKLILLLCHTV